MVATVNCHGNAERCANGTPRLTQLSGLSVAGTRKTTLGYDAATGRLATMDAGGEFAWSYLAGTELKSALDYPNGARTEYTYESGRDLLTNVRNAKGETVYSNAPYSVCKEFIWDPTESVATKPLCFREYGQADAYLMHDGTKNVTDVIAANTAATQLVHYDYAPFGAVRSQSGSRAAANPYRFSSEFSDDTLGLVYYNYRHYDPTTGRWLSMDFIEEFGGSNLYLYTLNNPQNSHDLFGLVDVPEKCPSDIEQRKKYDHYFIVKNGQSYIIYEYRTDRQVSTPISEDGCSIPSSLKALPAGNII